MAIMKGREILKAMAKGDLPEYQGAGPPGLQGLTDFPLP